MKVRLPFRLGFAKATPGPAPTEEIAQLPPADIGSANRAVVTAPADPSPAAAATALAPGAAEVTLAPPEAPAPPSEEERLGEASAKLVWLAYTSALSSRATTLEDAALAALEGRLDAGPRRRAARETQKLATSLWLVEARDAARLAWEAAGLLDAGTLLGTGNALRLSQIVETLHSTLQTLPPPEALSPAGRIDSPSLLVVDHDESLGRELPIEAAVRGWRAKVIRQLSDPIDEQAAVIVLGTELLGDADKVARERLLAAHPDAPVIALASGPSLLERAGAHGLHAARTLAKPISPAALVDEAIALHQRHLAAPPTIVLGISNPALRAAARPVLEALGTVVEAHEHNEAVWDTLSQLRPDVCVLDETCAGGTSLHVPRAMRREWDVATTSVVLVTTDTSDATIARAVAAGVDDCVPAAAVAALLPAMVTNRLERARTLRLAADVDPVTRLPHLRSIVPTLERMVAIARRYDHALAVFVVEVDGIRARRVSGDSETVDRLSQLLGRRLARAFRSEDLVAHAAPGRFVVGAFGMKSDDGVQRLAEMLEHFREQAVEDAQGKPVGASFSAGIAQIRLDGRDGPTLLRVAEAALATAQQQGGNRIEASSRGEASRIEWTADALVVDADAPFAALVEHALVTRGHRVRTINDGREALDLLTHTDAPVRARLIVLELGLPGLDGLSLLGQLAEAGVLKTTKAVVVTTRSVEAEMIKAMELGAVDYITKPVSLPVLMRRLRSVLAGGASVA